MIDSKKIIFVITNSHGVNQAFVTNDFKHMLLREAISLVRRGVLHGVHVVKINSRAYLRSNSNSSTKDNLDSLSVPAGSVLRQIKELDENEHVSAYAKAYGKFLEQKFERKELLYLGGVARIIKKDVIQRLQPLRKKILAAAEKYEVNPSLLAAILIDELARMGPDDLLDILGKLDVVDTTVGLAQIKMSTAKDLIKKKRYPANSNISQSELYNLLTDDAASVQFAAAYLGFIEKFRAKRNLGTSAAELASCYSSGLLQPVKARGKEIATKLRIFGQEILD